MGHARLREQVGHVHGCDTKNDKQCNAVQQL